MPEFTNEIIDLKELNRKVDANRQKKRRTRKRTALRVLIVQLICLLAVLCFIALRLSGFVPALLSLCVAMLATNVSAFATGWRFGYEKQSAV